MDQVINSYKVKVNTYEFSIKKYFIIKVIYDTSDMFKK